MLAWRLAAPYAGLEKATLLLAAIGMWPVLLAFYFGQPIIVVVALLALAWWLCNKQQPLAAGAALALATFLKPQDVILVPAVLLVSGRYRAVGGWMVGCLALGVATILTLGSSGLTSWAQALQSGAAVQSHFEYTLAYFFGLGPLTFILWTVQAVGALIIARLRRSEAETVFAVGILGSAAIAFHFHEADYSILILAAWLFLRTSPPLWHRLWLLIGILPMQNLVILGPAASQPQAIASHAPQLIWDALWLAILLATTLAGPRLRARFAGAP
jgi:hypothetical protein